MGQLVDGVWQVFEVPSKRAGPEFKRRETQFRDWIEDSADARFRPEPGRYHLYVSLACPWAHRTLIYRALKGLQDLISVTVVDPLMLEMGWQFSADDPDPIHGADYIHQVYAAARPDYTGRTSVPVLYDRREGAIVSNESADIIRMFNSAFDYVGARTGDYYPEALRAEIDAVNERVYATVNNGVYRTGFAWSQEAYEEAYDALFDSLDWLEQRLQGSRFLVADRPTEADWRLFPTLIRFDPVYYGHFKCNRQRLVEFPNLWAYTRELYQYPGVAGTVDFDHIKRHYYASHRSINPTGVVPKGPVLDLTKSERADRAGGIHP